jgi:hypothetical protein
LFFSTKKDSSAAVSFLPVLVQTVISALKGNYTDTSYDPTITPLFGRLRTLSCTYAADASLLSFLPLEFVRTALQRYFAQAIGCDYTVGYHGVAEKQFTSS